jgi:hypothetical protein
MIVDGDQVACLQLLSHAFEFLARAFRIAVEHTLAVKFLAPGIKLHDDGSRRQTEICRCRRPAAGRTFVEGRKSELLAR